MATRVVRKQFKVDGVPTNVTSAKLSDPTGTFGVKRNDTNAVIVADGTNMTNVATGVYEYSFEDVEGVAYTAYVEFVYDGQSYHFEVDFAARQNQSQVETSSLSEVPILTLADVVSEIAERNNLSDTDTRGRTKIIRAARSALRDIPSRHPWKYYTRDINLTVSPAVTLEIDYDHSTKVATVTDGSVPVDAIHGELIIGSFKCDIVSVDGAEITIGETSSPGEDYSGSAVWCRSSYPIPFVAKILSMHDGNREVVQVDSLTYSALNTTYSGTGDIVAFTNRRGDTIGSDELRFIPAPSISKTYVISVTLQPSHPTIHLETSAATGTSGTKTITCPSAKTSWVGSVLRIGQPGSEDTIRDILDANWQWQAIVTSVSGTTVTVSNNLPRGLSSETVAVSSVIDIDNRSMQTYYLAMVDEFYCRNSNQRRLREVMEHAQIELRNACASNNRAGNLSRFEDPYDYYALLNLGVSYPPPSAL